MNAKKKRFHSSLNKKTVKKLLNVKDQSIPLCFSSVGVVAMFYCY